ncbi:MAG: helix-turn-helix domain-containing protein [Firmicutes bacterium]|nr:helix-turn-helix domain-containing protein [Bacillota bacterium]
MNKRKPGRTSTAARPPVEPRVLGQRVRQAREALGLSQAQLAGTTFSRGYISLVERGLVVPSSRSLAVLARQLAKPVDYFLADSRAYDTLDTLTQAGEALWQAGRLEEAKKTLEEARTLAVRFDLPELETALTVLLGRIALAREEWGTALAAFDRALQWAVGQGRPRMAAEIAGCLGLAASGAGEVLRGVHLLRTAAAAAGDPAHRAAGRAVARVADQITGDWFLAQGAGAAAEAFYARALGGRPGPEDPTQRALLTARMATALVRQGETARAETWAAKALARADSLAGRQLGLVRAEVARTFLCLGRYADALRLLEQAYELLESHGPSELLAGVAELTVLAAARAGPRDRLVRWGFRVADTPADSRGWRRAKARAWGLLARLAHQEGDTTRTREYLLQALRCYTDGPGAWGLQIAAAAVRHAAGDPAAAPDLWALAARMPAAPPLLADADTALERRPFWPSWWTPADGEEA